MNQNLNFGRGSACNRVKIGGTTKLLGDPNIKPEKPYTIIMFPGGSVEIARCDDGNYWVHVATNQDLPSDIEAKIIDARIDAESRYCDDANRVLRDEISKGGVNHIAFLVEAPA